MSPEPDTRVSPTNLMDLNRPAMERFFEGLGEKSFRASQILKWIYQHDVDDFDAMTNISKVLRQRLPAVAVIEPPHVHSRKVSEDGTCKWLVTAAGGNHVETVFIPEQERGTLCVSSQVGCTLNCTFCSTGRQGFNRNLDTAEIIGQVWQAQRELTQIHGPASRITNIVMMGMGEPLLNFDNVTAAMDLMTDDLGMNLARKRVTLSTAGVVPAMDRLRERCPVSLAVSLHAPDDSLRDQLVPLNKKYPLRELMAACRRYVDGTRSKITFEYVMLRGVNDSVGHARKLVKLLSGVPSKVNLIPFNPFPSSGYERSSRAAIDRFREILQSAGFITITRKTRGDDIDAACGQLVGEVKDRTRRSSKTIQVAGSTPSGSRPP